MLGSSLDRHENEFGVNVKLLAHCEDNDIFNLRALFGQSLYHNITDDKDGMSEKIKCMEIGNDTSSRIYKNSRSA